MPLSRWLFGSGNDSVCESFIPAHAYRVDSGPYKKSCAHLLTFAYYEHSRVRVSGINKATEYHRL